MDNVYVGVYVCYICIRTLYRCMYNKIVPHVGYGVLITDPEEQKDNRSFTQGKSLKFTWHVLFWRNW